MPGADAPRQKVCT